MSCLGMEKQNLTQQERTFTNEQKCTTTQNKHKKLVPCGTSGRLLLSGFQLLVTLTLTLERVIWHTVVHQSWTSIYIPNFIEIRKTFFWTD